MTRPVPRHKWEQPYPFPKAAVLWLHQLDHPHPPWAATATPRRGRPPGRPRHHVICGGGLGWRRLSADLHDWQECPTPAQPRGWVGLPPSSPPQPKYATHGAVSWSSTAHGYRYFPQFYNVLCSGMAERASVHQPPSPHRPQRCYSRLLPLVLHATLVSLFPHIDAASWCASTVGRHSQVTCGWYATCDHTVG